MQVPDSAYKSEYPPPLWYDGNIFLPVADRFRTGQRAVAKALL